MSIRRRMSEAFELHVISSGSRGMDEFVRVAAEIRHAASWIHIREKARSAAELCRWISAAAEAGVPLAKIAVNERVDAAWTMNAGGAHLGAEGLPADAVKRRFPGLRIGKSVHSLAEAELAERAGADYVMYGHIYASPSKPGTPGRGLRELARIVSSLTIPVIAVGGITPERAGEIIAAGAAGIAVISGIWEAEDAAARAAQYRDALRKKGEG